MPSTFTLRMVRSVSDVLLPDIKALIAPELLQFFSNGLDDTWQYTLLCQQSDETCSLVVSAILFWYQLKRIHCISYSDPDSQQDRCHSSATEMFIVLKMPGAVLQLS